MKFIKFAILISVISFCNIAHADQSIAIRQPELIPSDKILTLSDCINLALKNQPSVRQAAAQVDLQSGQVMQARSGMLPGVSVTSSRNLDGSVRSGGTDITVSGSQLIYDFGRSQSQLTQTERRLAASLESLRGTQANVVLNVKQTYYASLRANHLVDVFNENLKAQDEHVASARERMEAKQAPQADVLKAQAAAASARVDLVTAQNNANQTRVDLNMAMGVYISSPIQIAEVAEAETPVLQEDQLLKLAMERRPEIRGSAEQVTAAEAAIKTSETGNLPALTTSLSKSHSSEGEFGTSNSWAWRLSLGWSLYDSGSTAGAVKQSHAQLVSAHESLYSVKQTVSREVVQARLSVIAADEQLTASTAEVASAKENQAAAAGRYKAGVGIILEVLDAQTTLLKAQVDELAARYGLSIARAELEHAIGEKVNDGGNN